jgi:hypothetical protein
METMSSDHKITMSSVVVATQEQVGSRLGEEAVILSLKNSTYYGLNEVGSTIWEMVKEPTAVSVIRDALCAQYEVDPDQCEQDLISLLGELAGQGLIEIHDPSAG